MAKQLIDDPDFFKGGGNGVLILLFIYYIFNAIEKKIRGIIDRKIEISEKLVHAELQRIELSVKNMVHDEFKDALKSLEKESDKQYKHLLVNIQNIESGAIYSIDQKHDEIEMIGERYLKAIKEEKE